MNNYIRFKFLHFVDIRKLSTHLHSESRLQLQSACWRQLPDGHITTLHRHDISVLRHIAPPPHTQDKQTSTNWTHQEITATSRRQGYTLPRRIYSPLSAGNGHPLAIQAPCSTVQSCTLVFDRVSCRPVRIDRFVCTRFATWTRSMSVS